MRGVCVVVLVLVLLPGMAGAQSFDRPFSVQAAAGPTVVDAGHHVSAAIGFAPSSRVTFLLDVQRTQISSRVTRRENYVSKFRGGTLTAVSGEVRVALWPADRVTPFVLAGIGVGVARPTVNADFPDPAENDARFVFFGGGVQVPLGTRFSVFGDARMLIGNEGRDGLLVMYPVRAGVAWRF